MLTALILTACKHAPLGCEDTEVTRIASPSSARDAVVYARDCGATTDYTTLVAIVPHGGTHHADSADDIYVADPGHGSAPTGAHGKLAILPRWTSDSSLVLATPKGARAFSSRTTSAGGVTIVYEPDGS